MATSNIEGMYDWMMYTPRLRLSWKRRLSLGNRPAGKQKTDTGFNCFAEEANYPL